MAKKYIELEAAIAMFEQAFDNNWEVSGTLDRLRAIPAADVVEVVRCRECRFLERGSVFDLSGEEDKNASFCSVVGFSPDDDWYCADGKRKDGGQDDG